MTSERWQQINTLLDAVLDLPPGEQQAYLDRHCAEDAELREEVTSLLQAHGEARTFMEQPAREYAASLVSSETPLDADPLVGTEIDGYRILSVLGRGGMGVVYQAEDEALSRTVALKMIAPTLARDAGFAQRFKREARVLARIDSAHIVRIHALRQTEAGLFIVMEYVDGGTLMDLIENGPVPWQRALPLIMQMLTALEQAHSVDIVHRDIKPHNIMLTRTGQVKVTDFGLAKVHQTDGAATVTQGIAGTLYYMSPEQVRGLVTLDHRTDLYSMGLTIYQMLTGALPFDRGGGEFDIMRAIVEKDFPSPTHFNADLPEPIAEAVMKALAKDPEARYQNAQEMREAFGALQDEEEDDDTFTLYRPPAASGHRAVWYGAAGVLAVLLAAAAYFFWPSPPSPPGGLLSVATTPPGATVYLDGQRLDATPFSNHAFVADLDSLALRIEKDGYTPVDTMLRVTQGQPLSLDLTLRERPPPTVRTVLQITSTPGDARVQINGEERGRTDANGVLTDLEVEPGTILVEVRRDGYKPWRGTQTLEAGATWAVAADLEREAGPGPGGGGTETQKAIVTLGVKPSGTVEVEGETCQSGRPCTITPGQKQVTFRYKNYKKTDTLTFGPGQTKALTCYFEHTVVVQVRQEDGSPIWGSIMADGQEVSQTFDTELTLEPGTRTIAVQKFGYDIVGVQRNGNDVAPGVQTFQIAPAYEPQRERLVFQIRAQ